LSVISRICGSGQDGHSPHQSHGRLLDQQTEITSFSRYWNLDLLHAVLRATDLWHGSRDEAMVLEEVQAPQVISLKSWA